MDDNEELLILVDNIRSNVAVIAIGVWGGISILIIGLIVDISGIK